VARASTPRSDLLLRVASAACAILISSGTAQPATHPHFLVVSANYRDLDGDRDIFPDTGETGRVAVLVRNGEQALTGATFVLVSSDPGVDCITERRVSVGKLAADQTMTVGSLDPAPPGFTFRVSNSLNTVSGTDPARIQLCLRLSANEFQGLSDPVCFNLLADLDTPPGMTQTFIPGPDGVTPSPDDGTLLENFDVDRDGDGNFTVNDTFRMTDAGTGVTSHGFYMRGSNLIGQAGTIGGLPCGGFRTPAEGNTGCILNPAYPMDWHLHCPPGATDCPNIETGTCLGFPLSQPCFYDTPADGQEAISPPNSLHMGAHFDLSSSAFGDTTHLRTLQAFVSGPINLALYPRPGDLELSMYQIVSLVDDTVYFTGASRSQCFDCADVQVQVDRNADPALDDWGPWEKLVPFQNVYDHMSGAWSVFTPLAYYCQFTPADAGSAPPAPRGAHETMCFPQGAWSRCGSVGGRVPGDVSDCAGPGVADPSGHGVWVQTRFNLAAYVGQRIRVRWIGQTWMFDATTTAYPLSTQSGVAIVGDEGWWLDDIKLTGVVTSQVSPSPDSKPAPPTSCPALCADIDGDGYGAPGSAICPAGPQTDCNDLNATVHPGSTEVCNAIDDDCNGLVDDGLPTDTYYLDADGDGIGNSAITAVSCAPGYVNAGGDCNDSDAKTWAIPSEVQGDQFTDATTLTWAAPAAPGSTVDAYDVLQSTIPTNFGTAAICVAVNSSDTRTSNLAFATPSPGQALFYLVRARDSCGQGTLGTNSSGVPRAGRACP
jgi:hypothetical protein